MTNKISHKYNKHWHSMGPPDPKHQLAQQQLTYLSTYRQQVRMQAPRNGRVLGGDRMDNCPCHLSMRASVDSPEAAFWSPRPSCQDSLRKSPISWNNMQSNSIKWIWPHADATKTWNKDKHNKTQQVQLVKTEQDMKYTILNIHKTHTTTII